MAQMGEGRRATRPYPQVARNVAAAIDLTAGQLSGQGLAQEIRQSASQGFEQHRQSERNSESPYKGGVSFQAFPSQSMGIS